MVVTALFVVVGPPLGGLMAWLGMGAWSGRSPVPFTMGSYGEGILLAFGTGLIVGVAGLWFGMRSWLVPMASALIVNAVFFVLTAGVDLSQGDYPGTLLRIASVFLPPSLAAAWGCWFLTRRIVRPG